MTPRRHFFSEGQAIFPVLFFRGGGQLIRSGPPNLPIVTQRQSLNVSNSQFLELGKGAMAAVMPQLTSLTALRASHTLRYFSSDQGSLSFLTSLLHLISLEDLFLADNSLSDDLCSILAASLFHLHQIQRLELHSNGISASFSSLRDLSEFGLSDNNIGDAECRELAKALPSPLATASKVME